MMSWREGYQKVLGLSPQVSLLCPCTSLVPASPLDPVRRLQTKAKIEHSNINRKGQPIVKPSNGHLLLVFFWTIRHKTPQQKVDSQVRNQSVPNLMAVS